MSTIHEFPKNYERFIAKGEEALVEHNQIAALENFQQAYQLQQTPPVNQKIVQLLLEMGEADEALALAEAFQETYFENLETAAIYMQIYSQSRRFIEGYILLKQLLQTKKITLAQQKTLEQQLMQVEEAYQQLETQQIQAIKRNLLVSDQLPVYQQLANIKTSLYLPKPVFVEVAKDLVMNQALSYFAREWFIEELALLQFSEPLTFLWYDNQPQTVLLEGKTGPLNTPIYSEICTELRNRLENDDPIMLQHLEEEIRLHLAYLYPLAETVISDPTIWVLGYLATYYPKYIEKELTEAKGHQIDAVQNVQQAIRTAFTQIML
ncbi:hypothetical protein ACR6L3_001499 [Enterococcus faecalis]|nr:hypothetical protein [Enterococcus faecalis]